ncbi:beta-1,4-galactosyltransferase 4 isoform X2 [Phalacrocorax aristotelis]|uniref:beta-1,4-galactosyltransferase 4 isoform X2 n=1 Tax=Phalacrocorax aristotelis TaxID=126867 RepID=UPI003F4C88B9
MALSLHIVHLFYKFKVLVLAALCLMVLWATFSYFVDSRQQISKAKSMVEDFRKLTSLEDIQKEEKTESIAHVPTAKSFQGHCPALSPYLRGASKLTFKASLTLEEVQKENPQVAKGRYHPTECSALQHVAILIPHRNREKHLLYLLEHLHPFLQRQQLDYGIYVIHQAGSTKFNRAKLLNVGYLEALKEGNWDCFIFHDVDLVPENDFNIYMCDRQPKHLVVGRNSTGYRVEMQKMRVVRPPADVGRYTMIFHKRDHGNEENGERMKLLRQVSRTWKTDGLNSCSYKLLSLEHNPLYVNITVDFSMEPKMS